MPDIRTAFENKGFEDKKSKMNPSPKHSSGRGREGGNSDEQRTKDNIIRAFGKDYTRLILDFKKEEYNHLVGNVKDYVEKNARNITTSQLRNIFGKVLQAKEPFDVFKLRPKLAYVAGRTDKWQMKELVFLLDELIQSIQNEDQLKNFKDFFESIIAYHRFFNPKGN